MIKKLLLLGALAISGSLHAGAFSPLMGWNSWNTFGRNVNEKLIKEVTDTMVTTGLKDAGYHYVVIDGGWESERLGPEGELTYNAKKFPSGIKSLADYVHSKGLKFGLHLVAGTNTCNRKGQGSYGYEVKHVNMLRKWGVDFVKVDKCVNRHGWTPENTKDTFIKWGKLLASANIYYSMSAYQFYSWAVGIAGMARVAEDLSAPVGGRSGVKASFSGTINPNPWGMLTVVEMAYENNKWAKYAGNGYWNDPDMLTVGHLGLSESEQRSEFALWSVMTAPLFLGNDPREMTKEEQALITNKIAISINQDATEQGRLIASADGTEVWVKHLKGGSRALLLLNLDKKMAHHIRYTGSLADKKKRWKVTDVFANKILGIYGGYPEFKVKADSSLFLLLTPL